MSRDFCYINSSMAYVKYQTLIMTEVRGSEYFDDRNLKV